MGEKARERVGSVEETDGQDLHASVERALEVLERWGVHVEEGNTQRKWGDTSNKACPWETRPASPRAKRIPYDEPRKEPTPESNERPAPWIDIYVRVKALALEGVDRQAALESVGVEAVGWRHIEQHVTRRIEEERLRGGSKFAAEVRDRVAQERGRVSLVSLLAGGSVNKTPIAP